MTNLRQIQVYNWWLDTTTVFCTGSPLRVDPLASARKLRLVNMEHHFPAAMRHLRACSSLDHLYACPGYPFRGGLAL